MQFDVEMLYVVISISNCNPNTRYKIQYKKIKIVKLVKFHVTSDDVTKL
jgi:hypothetical protein